MNKAAKFFSPEKTIIYKNKYLFDKTYKFGYPPDIKVFFKSDLSTV